MSVALDTGDESVYVSKNTCAVRMSGSFVNSNGLGTDNTRGMGLTAACLETEI